MQEEDEERKRLEEEKKEIEKRKEQKEKEIYFEKYYSNRNLMLFIGASFTGRLNLFTESETDNTTMLNSTHFSYSGYTIGLRYYFASNISLYGSLGQESLTTIGFEGQNKSLENSGKANKIEVGSSYHWYFTNWDLYSGIGISNYTYSAFYRNSSSGMAHDLIYSETLPHVVLGFDYNFMNDISLNFQTFFVGGGKQKKVSVTNHPEDHTATSPFYEHYRITYRF